MSSRPIISYDDITLPYDATPEPSLSLPDSFTGATLVNPASTGAPPNKKRKKNHKNKQRNTNTATKGTNNAHIPQSSSVSMGPVVADASMVYEDEGDWDQEVDEDESRELTHDEIWDDSALVNAWDAAMEEYEMFHGPGKDWKNEPVKKSPLWYNIPPKPSAKKPSAAPDAEVAVTGEEDEEDSQPLNFDTFVPTHDPTLETPVTSTQKPAVGHMSENFVPDAASAGSMVTQDEAFQRALNAMYWGGYWTAMYHAQRHYGPKGNTKRKQGENDSGTGEEDEAEVDEEEDDGVLEAEDAEMDEFVDTQR